MDRKIPPLCSSARGLASSTVSLFLIRQIGRVLESGWNLPETAKWRIFICLFIYLFIYVTGVSWRWCIKENSFVTPRSQTWRFSAWLNWSQCWNNETVVFIWQFFFSSWRFFNRPLVTFRIIKFPILSDFKQRNNRTYIRHLKKWSFNNFFYLLLKTKMGLWWKIFLLMHQILLITFCFGYFKHSTYFKISLSISRKKYTIIHCLQLKFRLDKQSCIAREWIENKLSSDPIRNKVSLETTSFKCIFYTKVQMFIPIEHWVSFEKGVERRRSVIRQGGGWAVAERNESHEIRDSYGRCKFPPQINRLERRYVNRDYYNLSETRLRQH